MGKNKNRGKPKIMEKIRSGTKTTKNNGIRKNDNNEGL